MPVHKYFPSFLDGKPTPVVAESEFYSERSYELYKLMRKVTAYRKTRSRIIKYITVNDSEHSEEHYNSLMVLSVKILDTETQIEKLLCAMRNGAVLAINLNEIYRSTVSCHKDKSSIWNMLAAADTSIQENYVKERRRRK